MKKILRFIALLCAFTIIASVSAATAAPSQYTSISPGTDTVMALAPGGSAYYRFEPVRSGVYTVTSSGNADPLVRLYDKNDTLLAFDDDSGGNGNFSLTYPLLSGNVYYLYISANGTDSSAFSIRIDRGNQYTFSGSAGSGVNWTLNALNGTLSITGEGEIGDYSADDPAPWFIHRRYITTVSVGSQITGIGDYAFFYCSRLAWFSGGTGVKTIGSHSFARSGIEELAPMSRLTEIGDSSFSYCSKLESADLANVTTIGENCFENCTSLKNITFGDALREIGEYAFNGCTSLGSLNLKGRETVIGDYAFSRSGVGSAALAGTRQIGKGAFFACKKIGDITIPATVQSVGARAFASCSDLDSVTFNGAAPKVMAASTGDRSFDEGVQMSYLTGRSGWTEGWQGYSVVSYRSVGDINNDGEVNNADLILVARLVVGLMEADSSVAGAADYNGDGEISNVDIILSARHIVGL